MHLSTGAHGSDLGANLRSPRKSAPASGLQSAGIVQILVPTLAPVWRHQRRILARKPRSSPRWGTVKTGRIAQTGAGGANCRPNRGHSSVGRRWSFIRASLRRWRSLGRPSGRSCFFPAPANAAESWVRDATSTHNDAKAQAPSNTHTHTHTCAPFRLRRTPGDRAATKRTRRGRLKRGRRITSEALWMASMDCARRPPRGRRPNARIRLCTPIAAALNS